MGSGGDGNDVEAGFAKLQGEDFEYYMQTYSIILGRNSKKSTVDVDLSSLGGGMNISRNHARIFYDFQRRRFALEVLGKYLTFPQVRYSAPHTLFSFASSSRSKMINTGEEGKSTAMAALRVEKYTTAAQISLRFMAMAATLAATWIVFTSKETVVVYGITAVAKYSYSPSYKFFAAANLIACVLSAISLLMLFVLRKTLKSINYFYFFLHDVVVMTLLMAGCSAATAVGYIGQYGNKHAGWIAICGFLHKYCDKMTISVTLSYIGFLFYFFLTIISASKTIKSSTTQVIK